MGFLVAILMGVSLHTLRAEEPAPLPALKDLPAPKDLPVRDELPDPLVFLDGTPVKTKADWTDRRRPELIRLFQEYVYGYLPPPPGIVAKILKKDERVLGGKATLKEIEISFVNLADKPNAPKIHLALFLPNANAGPKPVFLAINSNGNQTVVSDEAVRISQTATGNPNETARGSQHNFWCVEQTLDRGYAFATFCQNDIDPDKNDFKDGIHPFYPEFMKSPKTHWGTIGAWAWTFHRCVDYLVTDGDIHAKRIAVIGHSRRGKTALLAGAFDERIALVVPHQSGTGGMSLSRNREQETVGRITTTFPHWFNENFRAFADHEKQLPIDQHLLAALVAPRALLDTEGSQDAWANFPTSLKSIQAADKTWKFLGAPGMTGDGLHRPDEQLNDVTRVGNLAQVRLDEKHTLNQNFWKAILDFADGQFGRK